MAKEFAKKFYNSKAWRTCRQSYIDKRIMIDCGKCERVGCDNIGYILHHKVELTPVNIHDPDITLNHCNLEYVCKQCHDDIHYSSMHGIKQTVLFDTDGNMIPYSDGDR